MPQPRASGSARPRRHAAGRAEPVTPRTAPAPPPVPASLPSALKTQKVRTVPLGNPVCPASQSVSGSTTSLSLQCMRTMPGARPRHCSLRRGAESLRRLHGAAAPRRARCLPASAGLLELINLRLDGSARLKSSEPPGFAIYDDRAISSKLINEVSGLNEPRGVVVEHPSKRSLYVPDQRERGLMRLYRTKVRQYLRLRFVLGSHFDWSSETGTSGMRRSCPEGQIAQSDGPDCLTSRPPAREFDETTTLRYCGTGRAGPGRRRCLSRGRAVVRGRGGMRLGGRSRSRRGLPLRRRAPLRPLRRR